MFLKELILIKQVHQKSVIFVITGIFLNKGFKCQPYVCNRCLELLMMLMNLKNTAILKIKIPIIVGLLQVLAKVKL